MHFVWKPRSCMMVPKGNVLEISADIFPSYTANKRGKVNLHDRKGRCFFHESSLSSHIKRSNHSTRVHILPLICFILAKNADYCVWFFGDGDIHIALFALSKASQKSEWLKEVKDPIWNKRSLALGSFVEALNAFVLLKVELSNCIWFYFSFSFG